MSSTTDTADAIQAFALAAMQEDDISVSIEGDATALCTCTRPDGDGIVDGERVCELAYEHDLTVIDVRAGLDSGALEIEVTE